jgi:hypothetical protein
MTSVEEQLAKLKKAEREAHGRLMRVRTDINDGAVINAAEKLWTEAAVALRDYQNRNRSS